MKKKIEAIVLFFTVFIIIYLSFKLKNDESDEILTNHYEVIGMIVNVGMKTVDVSYKINNETYTYTQNKPYKNLVAGEEFSTFVSKENPNRAIVFYDKPILDTTKYEYASVSPIEVNKLIIDSKELSFEYVVGKESFSRIQKYSEGNIPENFKLLKVEFRIDKPEIGYLMNK